MYTLLDTVAWILRERVREEPGFYEHLLGDPYLWVAAIAQEVLGDVDRDNVRIVATTIDVRAGLRDDAWLHADVSEPVYQLLRTPVVDPAAVAVDVRDAEYELRTATARVRQP